MGSVTGIGLIENMTNSKYTLVHDAYYAYYRTGMDQLYDKPAEGRAGVLNALNMLNNVNQENPRPDDHAVLFPGRKRE